MVIPRIALALLLALPAAAQPLSVTLRSRTETFRGSGEWQEVAVPCRLEPRRTAIIICDVWDDHWCRGATQRVGLLAPKIAKLVEAARPRGIDHLLITGMHTNMCILNRTFAIKQMTRWGKKCILVRDLTDAMYDPRDRPYVSHAQGTELVIQHIEKYWSPTVLSADLLRALAKR